MAPAAKSLTPEAPAAPAARPRGIRRIETAFFVGNDFYAKGTTVRVGHPLIDEYPQFFYPAGSVDIELDEEEV
jgi:hypothetical protein